MKPQSLHLGFITAAILAISSGHANAVGPAYTFTDLGTLGGGSSSFGSAINNAGQVTGYSDVADGNTRAVQWNGTVAVDLGTIAGGSFSFGSGINNAGQVAGYSDIGGARQHAVRWNGTVATDLGTLGGGSLSFGYAINNAGQVTGQSDTADGDFHAVRWNGTMATDLGTLGGSSSIGYAINNTGQVVGAADVASGFTHAARWNGTVATDLGTLNGGNSNSNSNAINDAGQVAGSSDFGGGQHAVRWDGTVATDLGTLGGDSSVGFAINAAGEVVGTASDIDGAGFATLWQASTAINLNSFLDMATRDAGWVLTQATGINDSGTIVGTASNSITGEQHAFTLSAVAAVPEPETYALMLAGLGVLGFIARRRKAQ